MALNPRQQKFVDGYLAGKPAYQAYIDAGYKVKDRRNAESNSSALLRNPKISAIVEAAEAKAIETAGISVVWVIQRLVENVKRAMTPEQVLDREGNPTGRWTWNGSIANRSLELLGKHLGMFSNRVEITGKDGSPIPLRTTTSLLPSDIFAAQALLAGDHAKANEILRAMPMDQLIRMASMDDPIPPTSDASTS